MVIWKVAAQQAIKKQCWKEAACTEKSRSRWEATIRPKFHWKKTQNMRIWSCGWKDVQTEFLRRTRKSALMRSKVCTRIWNCLRNRSWYIVHRHSAMHGSIWMIMDWKRLMFRWRMYIWIRRWSSVSGKRWPGKNWRAGTRDCWILITNGFLIRWNGERNEIGRWKNWNFHLFIEKDRKRWLRGFTMQFPEKNRFLFRRRLVLVKRCQLFFRRSVQLEREKRKHFFIWRPGRLQGLLHRMHLKFWERTGYFLRQLRSQRKRSFASAKNQNAIQRHVPMRRGIMTESTMQYMNCGQTSSRLTGKRFFDRQKNGRYVRLKWVWSCLSGWMQLSVIIIMYLIRMYIWKDFSEKIYLVNTCFW